LSPLATAAEAGAQAGLKVKAVQQYQRYPLSNHLYRLYRGKPGGHQQWNFLDDADMNDAYAKLCEGVG
jgi:hypothetical protein